MKLNTEELYLVHGGSVRTIWDAITRLMRTIHIYYLMHKLFID